MATTSHTGSALAYCKNGGGASSFDISTTNDNLATGEAVLTINYGGSMLPGSTTGANFDWTGGQVDVFMGYNAAGGAGAVTARAQSNDWFGSAGADVESRRRVGCFDATVHPSMEALPGSNFQQAIIRIPAATAALALPGGSVQIGVRCVPAMGGPLNLPFTWTLVNTHA